MIHACKRQPWCKRDPNNMVVTQNLTRHGVSSTFSMHSILEPRGSRLTDVSLTVQHLDRQSYTGTSWMKLKTLTIWWNPEETCSWVKAPRLKEVIKVLRLRESWLMSVGCSRYFTFLCLNRRRFNITIKQVLWLRRTRARLMGWNIRDLTFVGARSAGWNGDKWLAYL